MTVYLLHLTRPYQHARHYLGSSVDVPSRVREHVTGAGSPLVAAAIAAGSGVIVSRTWTGGRGLERKLKNQHNAPRMCPVCRDDGGDHNRRENGGRGRA